VSDEAPVTRWTAALGWVGLVGLLCWQEFYVEYDYAFPTPWWFRVPVTIALGLALLVFALECLMQEMTVRRWAVSLVVFATAGLALLAAGIFDPDKLKTSPWILLPAGVFYLAAALCSGIAAKDNSD
jgi:hypothetical protein